MKKITLKKKIFEISEISRKVQKEFIELEGEKIIK